MRRLIKRMFIYSAIKIKAKVPLLYSVLKPETSSDSPSAKSKGARFVSAKAVVNQINSLGVRRRRRGVLLVQIMVVKFRDMKSIIGLRRIKIILTS